MIDIENLANTTGTGTLTGPEMVKQAVDWEYERRRNSKLHRLRRQGGSPQLGLGAVPQELPKSPNPTGPTL